MSKNDEQLNFADDFEDEEETTWTEADLRDLATLGNQFLAAQEKVRRLEEELDEAKRELFNIGSRDLPNRMDEIGMKEFLLDSGERIQVRRVVKASIPAKLRNEAFAWLRENGHGDLVKNEVKALFGRGEDDKARALLEFLQKKGMNVDQKESVHAGTLAAFVREQLKNGVDVPHELLGVFEYMETKVTKA